MKTNKYILTLALTLCCALGNLYAITSSYYSTIDGKKDSGLREALTVLLYNNHTKGLSYDWDFDGIDWDSNGNVYDIYSSCGHTKNDNTSSYKCCCDAINREHVVPQSTFDSKPPQYADRHHLYVVDGKANGYRSNYAFGECSGGTKGSCSNSSTVIPSEGTKTCSNHEFGKLGTSTFTEVKISDKVYEPGDEYKGDIARAIMYMVVRYATADYCKVKSGSGTSANAYPVTAWSASTNCGLMFSNTLDTNYGLSAYGKALLLKWHRNDPVSAREITRNEGVAAKQGNRNPFIDYPCLAEYLWGNKVGETVNLSELTGTFTGSWTTGDGCPCGDVPAITLPSSDIFVGSTEANTTVTKTITVQGVNLTANLSLEVSGTNSSLFSLSATSIQKTYAEAGTTVTITYTPTSAGSHSAVLTISGGGLAGNRTFNLSGTCCNPYTVTYSRNGITEQVGACGTFTLPTAEDEEDACDGWEFQGWVTSSTPFSEGQISAPTFVTEVNSATTLYAVYGKGSGSSGSTITLDATTDTSFPKDGITLTTSSGVLNNGTDYRIYKGATLTITSSVGDMSSIAFTFDGTYDGGGWATSYTPNSSTWTSSACTSGSSGKQARITQIVVTVGSSSSTTTYKKLPCTTYTISYVDEDGIATGGSYQASETTALAGTTISLDYDEAMGYEFTGWTVTNASTSATIAVTNGQFTMPEANVTVSASFTALCSKLNAPDVTATPDDGQITLTWSDVTNADHYTVSISKGEGYTTECGSAASIGNISHSGTTNTCVITGLTNGLEYTTYVVANGVSAICDSDADEDTAIPSAEIPTEVTVTFNANGGTGTMSDQTIPYNMATALDANAFTRTGYTFQGWATEQSGAKEYNDGASVTLTEDLTLYAVWQINKHSVTFNQPATGGTFTVNSSSHSPVSNVNYGSTVTIVVTPTNSHFTVNTVTVTGASGAVAVSGEGNTRTFTMPDEDVTVAVTMIEDPKYTVNWYVSGTPTAETKYAGETLVGIPTPSIECNDKVFQGWTETADYSSEDTAPADLFTDASTKTMPSNNNTKYYAVFATVEEETTTGEASWTETAITVLTSSDIFVIVGNNGSNYAMTNNNGTTSAPTATAVTISGGKISGTPADNLKWNISGNGTDGYTFYPNGSTTTWLYCTNSNNGVRVGTNDNKTFTIDGGYLKHAGTSRYVGIYNSQDWRCYTSNTGTSNIKDQTFAFYKYTEGSGSTTTTISGYTTSCAAPENVTVTFNANDGSDVPATATQTIPYNEETALDANTFSRTGYHFTGWNTATDGSGAAYTDEAEVTLTKDMTLYAQWAKNSYNVSFTPTMTGATITVNGQSTSPQSVAFESEVTIAVTTDVAYAVDEVIVVDGEDEPVSVTNNGDGTYTFTMPASAVTVTVTLTAQPLYTIRFIDNGAVISTQEVFDGQSADAPSDPTPCEGYAFAGWWDAPLTTPTTTAETWITDFTASANQDYYAVYSYSEESEGAPRRAKMEDEEYTLYSGALAEGDYIIYYDGKAMKATVTSGRLDYAEITPVNDKITSPDVSIVWHIAANGDYWTIYNADVEKYAAGTGVKNKAQLLADGTDDKALWTASGTETYDFVNKANAAAEVNATLRENGTYGYACYAAGTGGSLSLYKKSSSSGGGGTTTTTYYTTAPNCEPAVTPTDMMIVAEYGGARIALTHNNDYTSFGATPMMFVGGKYYYPNSESAATPVIADMTWQVAEVDGESYTIKAGEQYLAPNNGAIALNDEPYPWTIDEEGTICYDAKEQTFVVGGEGSTLPKIHTVPVPKADDIQLTSLHSDRTLTPKRFGTLCLPHAVALPFAWGVRVYSVAGAKRNDNGDLTGIYLEEETKMLNAGQPYMIEPLDENEISTMQMWYAEGMDYVTEPIAANAMVGNLNEEPKQVPSGYYGLSNNQLRRVMNDTQTIGQYKAYFDLEGLKEPATMQQAYAFKVMYVEESEQVVTEVTEVPVAINWDEPVYNILGMRVDRNATGVLIQGGTKFIIRVP